MNIINIRKYWIACQLVLFSCLFAQQASSSIISNEGLFLQSNKSMWGEGDTSSWNKSYVTTTNWNESLGRTNVGVGMFDVQTDGGVFMRTNASAYGGSLGLWAPVSSSLNLPDNITSGNAFSINTIGGLNRSDTFIYATAPSFQASVDLGFSVNASIEFDGKWFLPDLESKLKVNVPVKNDLINFDSGKEKPLNIFGFQVPGAAYDKEYHIRGNKNIFEYTLDETTYKIPGKPIIGDVELHSLKNIQGGLVRGNSVQLNTKQKVLSIGMSIPGMFEAYNGLPGLLQNSINIGKGVKAEYKLADLEIGPTFGMSQQFNFDTDLKLELMFDKPVTRIFSESNQQTYQNGSVIADLGDDLDLIFNDDVGNFLGYNIFMENSTLRNMTSVSIDPYLEVKTLCVKLSPNVLSETCLLDERIQTSGLFEVELFDKSWEIDGFGFRNYAHFIDYRGADTGGSIDVPEPSSLILFLFTVLGLMSQRKIATYNSESSVIYQEGLKA